MKSKKLEVIKCPVCGREYLPCEIYLPNSFFGRPQSIYRDSKEQIEGILGKGMDLKETYVCDSCNTPLKISASIQFFVKEDTTLNTAYEYKTNIAKNDLFLLED